MRINWSFKTRAENKNMETLDFWSAGAAVPGCPLQIQKFTKAMIRKLNNIFWIANQILALSFQRGAKINVE